MCQCKAFVLCYFYAGTVESCQSVAGADICKSGDRAIAGADAHGYQRERSRRTWAFTMLR